MLFSATETLPTPNTVDEANQHPSEKLGLLKMELVLIRVILEIMAYANCLRMLGLDLLGLKTCSVCNLDTGQGSAS